MSLFRILFIVLFSLVIQACGGSSALDEEPVVTVSATTAVANSQSFAIAQDTELTIKLEGENGASYSFRITTRPLNGILIGQLSGINPTLVYTPNAGFIGDDSFQFEVADDEGNTSTGTVSIQVISLIDANKDTDGDGLTDLDESNKYGTSPVLADTDADGFNDYKEVITFGFDASVNNLRFNPLIADIPQIDVQLTSAPDIFLNYTTASGSSSSVSTNRSESSTQSVTTSETLGESTSFEHAHTFGASVAIQAGVKIGVGLGAESSVTTTLSYTASIAYGEESSQSWSEEQSQENSTALDQGKAFEQSNDIATSGGGIGISVQVGNGGDISYTLSNLFLSATYIDLTRPDAVVPIGNLKFENALGFPSFTLAPGESSGQLNFFTSELGIDTTKGLLADSNGLIIQPAIFDMLDENGVSYTFNNTAMQVQDAMIIVDFAGLNGQRNLRLMVATNADPEVSGINISEMLKSVVGLSITTDASDGFLTSIAGISNNEPAGRWVMMHGAQSGNDTIITTVYTTPDDDSRVQSLNSNVGNIVSSYDITQISLHGGDILHLVYMLDDDQDGISNRDELMYGTDANNAHSDDDGLNDGAEVNGWEYSFITKSGATVVEKVTSNPLVSDTDDDGLSDFEEANVTTADSSLKRNPKSSDTDGDGLGDFIDDLNLGAFAPNIFDDLDIVSFSTVLGSTTVFPAVVTVSYDVLDVTETGITPGTEGNGIDNYRVHIYRHVTTNAIGSHPEPITPPLDFAPVVLGQKLTCGMACDWELVEISSSIPGAVTNQFIDSKQIIENENYKYIAYTQINKRYVRSKLTAFASAAVEVVTIHVLPGDGTNNTALTNVRTVTDFRTLLSDPAKRIEYSAEHNEIFISEGSHSISTVFGFKNALYGKVYDATTLAIKSVSSYSGGGFLGGSISVDNPTRFYYDGCPLLSGSEIPGNCWIESNVLTLFSSSPDINGYITDAVDANDVGNVLSHPLSHGDGSFTLDWLMKFDGSVITPRPGLVSNKLRHICDTYRSRSWTTADFNDDQSFDAVATVTTDYVRRPAAINSSCDGIDVFADTYTDTSGVGVYTIDPVTGGATFSRALPAQSGCYSIRFIAYEYNENAALNGGSYNKVAYPYSGEADFENTDDAELCRDAEGIWSLTSIQLETEHEPANIAVPATTANNPNFINYTTHPMAWDDDVARTTMEGRLRVNYLIEVTTP